MGKNERIKPIFHQNAKYLASGFGVGQCTRRQNFVLPNTKYTNMLVFLALGDAHFSRFYPKRNLKVAFFPTRNPNASQWNIGCVGCQRKISASGMYISCFMCRFHLRLVANANTVSGGIWALASRKFKKIIFYFYF